MRSHSNGITYDEAIDLLQEHENDEDADYEHLEHGDDFGSPHETWISNHFGVPTFVMNYPAAIKAFYMKPVPGNPERVLCADLLAPEGYGEIIGGSMREGRLRCPCCKMDELGMDRTEYEFYLDLRKYGTVPHGGFGIGIERMVTFAVGTKTFVKLFHSHVCCTVLNLNRRKNAIRRFSLLSPQKL